MIGQIRVHVVTSDNTETRFDFEMDQDFFWRWQGNRRRVPALLDETLDRLVDHLNHFGRQ